MTGLPPRAEITIAATSAIYHSSARFHASPDGVLSLATTAPDSGDYAGVDADGMFWSMQSDQTSGTQGYGFDFVVDADGAKVAAATLTRYWLPPGAKVSQVTDNGLVAVLVTPATPGPHPALIMFGGSEGGLITGQLSAEYYAALGYSCLGLAYFGAAGLQSDLDHVPLEYLGKAIDWMSARADVDPTRIGVLGASRGGELALLLAATYPKLKVAIALSPSGLVWSNTNATGAAWTLAGADVPFMPSSGAGAIVSMDADGDTVYTTTPIFLADMQAASAAATAAATIAVEKSSAAILPLGRCRRSAVAGLPTRQDRFRSLDGDWPRGGPRRRLSVQRGRRPPHRAARDDHVFRRQVVSSVRKCVVHARRNTCGFRPCCARVGHQDPSVLETQPRAVTLTAS